MNRKKIAWISGLVLGAVLFLPPVLSVINGVNLILGSTSQISYEESANFLLILEAWLIVGFLWWIILQILGGLSQFLFSFLLSWSSSLLFFSTLPYWLALPIWLAFSIILFLS